MMVEGRKNTAVNRVNQRLIIHVGRNVNDMVVWQNSLRGFKKELGQLVHERIGKW